MILALVICVYLKLLRSFKLQESGAYILPAVTIALGGSRPLRDDPVGMLDVQAAVHNTLRSGA